MKTINDNSYILEFNNEKKIAYVKKIGISVFEYNMLIKENEVDEIFMLSIEKYDNQQKEITFKTVIVRDIDNIILSLINDLNSENFYYIKIALIEFISNLSKIKQDVFNIKKDYYDNKI